MKTRIKLMCAVAAWCGIGTLSAQTEWKITGEALPEGVTEAVLEQAGEESNEYVWTGKLLNKEFVVTDGTKSYVAECGDTDPLNDSITLAERTDDEAALRIRYVKNQDYFKLTLTVDATGAKSLKAETVDLPKNMYVMGGPFNNKASNWELQDAIELQRNDTLPYLFYYKGDMRYNEIGSEGGNFKLLRGYSWTDNFHPAGTANVSLLDGLEAPLPMRMGEAEGDTKWSIPSDRSGDGYYELTVNTLDMTLTVDSFLHKDLADALPTVMYVTGTSIPTGFSTDNEMPMRMDQQEEGVYMWAGLITPGEFKFQKKRGSYMYAYMALENGLEIYSGQEYDVEYCESYFGQDHLDRKFVTTTEAQGEIWLDLNRLKAWVVGQPEAPSQVETAEGVEVSYFSRDGKLHLSSTAGDELQARIFGVDGRLVAERSFTGNTTVALPEGSYIVLLETADASQPATRLHTYVK